jgi:hypothetical protein
MQTLVTGFDVIPAKAGIHALGVVFMDPGFRRGDDGVGLSLARQT